VTRTGPPLVTRDFTAGDAAGLLQVNAGSRPHVAQIDRAELERLLGLGAVVLIAAGAASVAGYLIAFADSAPYDGEEFRYFQRHLGGAFAYIDQVAVSTSMRRCGVARALYGAVSAHPRFPAPTRRCCEVNIHPPNPVSMEFHRRLGFERLADLGVSDGRVVALLAEPSGGFRR
jgi:predicted GNAT superfamily acetyltransferase